MYWLPSRPFCRPLRSQKIPVMIYCAAHPYPSSEAYRLQVPEDDWSRRSLVLDVVFVVVIARSSTAPVELDVTHTRSVIFTVTLFADWHHHLVPTRVVSSPLGKYRLLLVATHPGDGAHRAIKPDVLVAIETVLQGAIETPAGGR